MSLVELGRYDRNLANIIVGRLDAEGLDAIAFDGGSSIADGSYLLIPVRVMVTRTTFPPRRRSLLLLQFKAAAAGCSLFYR